MYTYGRVIAYSFQVWKTKTNALFMFTARRYEHDKWQCHFFFRSDQTMIALYGAIYRKAHSFPTPKFDVMNGEILVHDKKKYLEYL